MLHALPQSLASAARRFAVLALSLPAAWLAPQPFAAGPFVAAAVAAERRPVPALTIYPGDIIRENMLSDADFPDAIANAPYATNRGVLLGKVARRTLLPGQAIPVIALGEPRLVAVGARVRVVFQEDGLIISTYASALQGGAAGDVVSVRNLDSGSVVSGTVAPDGSVHVGAS